MRILTKTPTMVAAWHRIRGGDQAIMPRDDLGHAANFLYMLHDKEPDPLAVKVMDATRGQPDLGSSANLRGRQRHDLQTNVRAIAWNRRRFMWASSRQLPSIDVEP